MNSVGTTYYYDGGGRRVKKVSGGTTTVYVYDAQGQLAAEYASAMTGDSPCTTCYRVEDHLGSTRLVTDASGSVVSLHDFLPWGEEIPSGVGGRPATYGAWDVTQRFTGKERDAETGLDFFGARYFSGAQGRFTSPDPEIIPRNIANPQAWNKYAYTYNNPLRYTDPDGRAPQDSLATQQFERDARAVLSGQMSKQEFQQRNAARAAGAAAGAGIVFAPEIGAFARGLWYAVTGYFMTPKGQETAASVLEGLSDAPPGSLTGNLARLSANEISTGERFAAQEGLQLRVGSHVGEEFVDAAGKTYDAMGQPNAYKFWNPKQFFGSIMDHLNKSNDYTIIDLKGASADQIKQIRTYVGTLAKEEQDKIKYVQ